MESTKTGDAQISHRARYRWIQRKVGWVRWIAFLIQHRLPLHLRHYYSPVWALHAKDFDAILKVIRRCSTKDTICLVELGAGISTLTLAYMMPRLFRSTRIISIEGWEDYAQRYQEAVKEHGLSAVASVYHVPYTSDGDRSWYDREALQHILLNREVDVLLVDAPPHDLCYRARQPAIPFFLPYLSKQSIVFLHDTHRQDERYIAEQWSHYFMKHGEIDTPRGIAYMCGKHV